MKFRGRFDLFAFCKCFRAQKNMILIPGNQVGTTLRDASLLCLAHKIVEAFLFGEQAENAQSWTERQSVTK